MFLKRSAILTLIGSLLIVPLHASKISIHELLNPESIEDARPTAVQPLLVLPPLDAEHRPPSQQPMQRPILRFFTVNTIITADQLIERINGCTHKEEAVEALGHLATHPYFPQKNQILGNVTLTILRKFFSLKKLDVEISEQERLGCMFFLLKRYKEAEHQFGLTRYLFDSDSVIGSFAAQTSYYHFLSTQNKEDLARSFYRTLFIALSIEETPNNRWAFLTRFSHLFADDREVTHALSSVTQPLLIHTYAQPLPRRNLDLLFFLMHLASHPILIEEVVSSTHYLTKVANQCLAEELQEPQNLDFFYKLFRESFKTLLYLKQEALRSLPNHIRFYFIQKVITFFEDYIQATVARSLFRTNGAQLDSDYLRNSVSVLLEGTTIDARVINALMELDRHKAISLMNHVKFFSFVQQAGDTLNAEITLRRIISHPHYQANVHDTLTYLGLVDWNTRIKHLRFFTHQDRNDLWKRYTKILAAFNVSSPYDLKAHSPEHQDQLNWLIQFATLHGFLAPRH